MHFILMFEKALVSVQKKTVEKQSAPLSLLFFAEGHVGESAQRLVESRMHSS